MKPSKYIALILAAALIAAALSFSLPASAAGPRCYVDADATTGADNGTSWTDAYLSLQTALADLGCTEIWVADGIYTPTDGIDRDDSFVLRSGVSVYGGFASGETSLSQQDFINNIAWLTGDLNHDDLMGFANNSDNSYHVVSMSGVNNTAILNGFYIQGGNANGSSAAYPKNVGGGILMDNSSPTLSNLYITVNSAANGAGMYISSSSPSLSNMTITTNHASGDGAGLYILNSDPTTSNLEILENAAVGNGGGLFISNTASGASLSGGSIDTNTAAMGGGMYIETGSPTLTGLTFVNNSSTGAGGGLAMLAGSPHFNTVGFSGNTSAGDGGAVSIFSSASLPVFQSSQFNQNSALNGGGISLSAGTLTIQDSIFDTNQASGAGGGNGGGIMNDSGTMTLQRITFSNNTATNGGGLNTFAGTATLTDVTFSDNNADAGAGVYNGFTHLDISDTTFARNNATANGGGFYNNNSGMSSAPVSLVNVTFNANTAFNGAGIYNAGAMELKNATLGDNTASSPTGVGAVLTTTPMTILNSILWGSGTELLNTGTDPIDIHDSIVKDGACPTTGWTCSNINSGDPFLEPLQNNGGHTQTMAITSGLSYAIDHGSNAVCPPQDQRGTVRPQDGNLDKIPVCDIGAYELQPGWTLFLLLIYK